MLQAAGPGFALTIAVTGDVQVSGAFMVVINTNKSSVEVVNQNLHQFCGLCNPQFGFSYIFAANRPHTRAYNGAIVECVTKVALKNKRRQQKLDWILKTHQKTGDSGSV